ncbi:MAG: hypothetical protein K2K27_02895 [Muribaculaceae bacterium]|nr:hypothetical protein [Muribaculaceae bacterium]MDE6643026.1 hypothetical protein [Muribaculaceae bacterium]
MKFLKTKKNYTHQENDQILEEWNNLSIKNGQGEIETDGVAYKGGINSFRNDNGIMIHERMEGNEEGIWNNSDKRILFVAKELNDPKNPYDSRVVMSFDPDNGIIPTHKFLKAMLFITSGLLNSTEKHAAEFNRYESMEKLMADWDKAAVAKINVKKQPGGSTSSFAEISKAMEDYKEFLVKQVQLLNANIIVCCDGRGVILNAIKDWVYPNAKKVNDFVWYDKEADTLLINSYHLSARKSYKNLYDRVISSYVDALAKLK